MVVNLQIYMHKRDSGNMFRGSWFKKNNINLTLNSTALRVNGWSV